MDNEERIAKIEESERGLTIPDETLKQVSTLSNDIAIWAKLDKGSNGFYFPKYDKIIPEIVGTIRSMTPYLVKFENNVPEKLRYVESDADVPPGFERRCDLHIDVGGTIVGLSLSPSSFKYQLSPYIAHLVNKGLRPEQIKTRIQARMASNSLGSWAIAVFSEAPTDDEMSSAVPVSGPQNEEPQQPQKATIPQQWA